jgi:hypothetical protein
LEWTTESGQQPPGVGGTAPTAGAEYGAAANGQPAAGGEAQPTEPLPVQAVAAATAPAGQPAPQAPNGYEQCPSCGAPVSSDQRYCLACGQRRGEPRLPFMDAVVFMDAMKRPPDGQAPPPKRKERRISPNAALIAGVGTLLLALGIGVLIGRSGSDSSPAPQAAPIVIKGGGGSQEAATESTAATTVGGESGRSGAKSKKARKKQAKHEAATNGGAEEVLKPKSGVKLPPPGTGVGDKCEKGTAGCQGGEFTGNFFGE